MPELPEVEMLRAELDRKLKGKKVREVKVVLAKMVAVGPATVNQFREGAGVMVRKFRKLLRGKVFTGVERRAKLLVLKLIGDLNILVHLKLTGQLVYEAASASRKTYQLENRKTAPFVKLPNRHTHVIFHFTDGSKLFFNDLRQFGYMRLVKEEDLPKVKELESFGPEPLEKSFTVEKLQEMFTGRPNRKIKELLMDQNVVAGIGNIYADEILFDAKIAPTRAPKNLRTEELKNLWKSIQKVLKAAIKHHGSSAEHFVRSDGSWGDYVKYHKVYQKTGERCCRCGKEIRRIRIAGRSAHFCPRCQR